MTLFTKTMQRAALQSAVLKWFVDEDYSFEQVNLLHNTTFTPAGGVLGTLIPVGTVVGQISQVAGGVWTVGAAAAAGVGGNTGNGTVALGAPAYVAGAVQVGTYEAVAISANEFEVYSPAGDLLGTAKAGVAFSTQITFTVTAGGTAFVAGDAFTFAVTNAGGGGQYVPVNPAATDGSQIAAGVVVKNTTVDAVNDTPTVIAARECVLLTDGLVFATGVTTNQKTAAIAQLAAIAGGAIISRGA